MEQEYARLGLIFQALAKGEAAFIECLDEECVIGVVGRCEECDGFYTWCNCPKNQIPCPCGRRVERGDPDIRIERLEAENDRLREQVAELELRLFTESEESETG